MTALNTKSIGDGKLRFHVMAKPVGPKCNLNCSYCFYLPKANLFKSKSRRMSDDVLEEFIRQYIQEQDEEEIVFTWQGGEPTLAGLEFYKKAVAYQRKHRAGKTIQNDLQTNGLLIDDDWCQFLKKHNFLVGLSIDGPEHLHDVYRKTNSGNPSFKLVWDTIGRLKKHDIPFNALVTINNKNAKFPLEVYRFLRDLVQPRLIQFTPCVEIKSFAHTAPPYWSITAPTIGAAAAKPGVPESIVHEWSVDPDDYGTFLCDVFDEWYQNDLGKIFVLNFECAVAQQVGIYGYMCTFGEICGKGLVIEHDGSIFSCDHYVYPGYNVGKLFEEGLGKAILSDKQRKFGFDKKYTLPNYCLECAHLTHCYGECPKNRLLRTPIGEPGLNYLCSGLFKYFSHIEPYIRKIANKM